MDAPFYQKWWFWVLAALVAVSLPFSIRYAIQGEPVESVEPDPPVVSEDPVEPETPVEPEEPVGPETPEPPVGPEGPEQPEQPEQPTEPEQPADTEAPEPPVGPEGPEPTDEPEPGADPVVMTYVLNTNSHRFHYPDCESVGDMKESNRRDFTGTREELIAEGYKPCGRCQP